MAIEQNNLDEACGNANKALVQNPNCLKALCVLGQVALKQNNLDEALVNANKALTQKPNCPEAYCILSQVALAQEKLEEAFDYANKALAQKPNCLEALCVLSQAALKQNNLDEALVNANKTLAQKPNCLEALCVLGQVALEQNNLNEAFANAKKALAQKPNCPEALCVLGQVALEQNNLNEAFANAKKALAQKPNCPEALCVLGQVALEQNNLNEAFANAKKALAQKPNCPEALCVLHQASLKGAKDAKNQGNYQKELKYLKEAYKNIKKIEQFKRDDPKLLCKKAEVLLALAQNAQESVNVQLLIELKDDFKNIEPKLNQQHPGILYSQALVLIKLAEYEKESFNYDAELDLLKKADKAFISGAKLVPDDDMVPSPHILVLFSMAENANKRNSPEEALKSWERIGEIIKDTLQLKQSYAGILTHQASALFKRAECQEKCDDRAQTIWQETKNTAKAALAEERDVPYLYYILSRAALELGELTEELDHFEEALGPHDINNIKPFIYSNIGLTYKKFAERQEEQLVFWEKADEAFDKVLQLLKKSLKSFKEISLYIDTCDHKCTNLIEWAKYEEEIGDKTKKEARWLEIYKVSREALKLSDENNLRLLGIASEASLKLAENAITFDELHNAQSFLVEAFRFEKALNLNNDFNRLIRIGKGWVKVGNTKKVLEVFHEKLKLNTNDAELYYNIGLDCTKLADEAKKSNNREETLTFLETALESINKSLAINPSADAYIINKAQTCKKLAEQEEQPTQEKELNKEKELHYWLAARDAFCKMLISSTHPEFNGYYYWLDTLTAQITMQMTEKMIQQNNAKKIQHCMDQLNEFTRQFKLNAQGNKINEDTRQYWKTAQSLKKLAEEKGQKNNEQEIKYWNNALKAFTTVLHYTQNVLEKNNNNIENERANIYSKLVKQYNTYPGDTQGFSAPLPLNYDLNYDLELPQPSEDAIEKYKKNTEAKCWVLLNKVEKSEIFVHKTVIIPHQDPLADDSDDDVACIGIPPAHY